MRNTLFFLTLLTGLALATRTRAQIGWTLDQCKAKYGEASKDHGEPQTTGMQQVRSMAVPYGETYTFNPSGFTVAVALSNGVVAAIEYESEAGSITFEQAKEILANNASTTWRKDNELSDDETDTLVTKSNHNLRADLYLDYVEPSPLKADHNSISELVIIDDTVSQQMDEKADAADKE
jgi:uncharacterized protein YcnI